MAKIRWNPFAKGKTLIAKGQLDDEATEWWVRMHDSDAERYRAEFERWLARGALHRAAYNRFAQHYLATGKAKFDALPETKPIHRTMQRTRFALAGSIVVISVVGWRLITPTPPTLVFDRRAPATVSRPAHAQPQYVTALGEIRKIRLPDGSRLTMDTDTLVLVDYRTDKRELRLEHGRARFEVAHERRPFVVDAGDSEVIAHGTVFDVSYWDERTVQVQLLRGAIDVRRRIHTKPGPKVELTKLLPGQSLRYGSREDGPQTTQPAAEPVPNWPSGSIEFVASTVGEVVDIANRYSAVKIRLADPSIGALAVSGVFRVNDPDKLATSLALLFNLRLTKDTGTNRSRSISKIISQP